MIEYNDVDDGRNFVSSLYGRLYTAVEVAAAAAVAAAVAVEKFLTNLPKKPD